ncbi:esterase-like activity of phytase family protein [Aurantivibrio plasticivorans]
MKSNSKKSVVIVMLASTIALLPAVACSSHQSHKHTKSQEYFTRVATFPVYENLSMSQGDQLDDETSAEISAASQDGMVVYYSNSPKERVGMVDISDISSPEPAGFIQLDGEPTSVAVNGKFLLVAVNTSPSFTEPSGKLSVYSIEDPKAPVWVKDFDVEGQPDAIAVSPDGRYAAIAIENERDEDLNDGVLPQFPAGHLISLKMKGDVHRWKRQKIALTGYADIAPADPEPEYVTINRSNIAAVSLQENNHIVLVNLRKGKVIKDFSAGAPDLFDIDAIEDDVINPVDMIADRRREPDAIAWVGNHWIASANEGDYEDENGVEGGSRGFTLFKRNGKVKYESGASFEHHVLRAGHYPENRSENKGIEPEAVLFEKFGRNPFLFVGSERGNIVGVYTLHPKKAPRLHQLLPTTIGPEGVLAIPERNLLVVSSEVDDANEGFRSTIGLYQFGASEPNYPQIVSDAQRLIPWGALSGMVADRLDNKTVYLVPDSYYKQSRFFTADVSQTPAVIKSATVLTKDGEPVDYDLEGIAQRADGSFWMVSEGKKGTRPNLLILVSKGGEVLQEVLLPENVISKQKNNGFEGVAVVGSDANEYVVVAFQREWSDDPAGFTRIGFYSPATEQWTFAYYPLDTAQPDTWIGLSEISAIDDQRFVVVERDNQQGPSAQVKRLYQFSIAGVVPVAEGQSFPILSKTLVKDVLPDLQSTNGWVVDKLEGVAITPSGNVFVSTDNDGVDDAAGETRFINLGKLF